jgi:hypothetical protein
MTDELKPGTILEVKTEVAPVEAVADVKAIDPLPMPAVLPPTEEKKPPSERAQALMDETMKTWAGLQAARKQTAGAELAMKATRAIEASAVEAHRKARQKLFQALDEREEP